MAQGPELGTTALPCVILGLDKQGKGNGKVPGSRYVVQLQGW